MKKALIIIGSVIGIFLLVAFFLPSQVHVERSTVINAPVDLVFDQVNDLEKNFNWSPWMEYDPEMKVEWGESKKGEGASYSWSGNSDVGSGTMLIAKSVENEYIQNDIDFGEMGKGMGTWKFEKVSPPAEGLNNENDPAEKLSSEGIKVTWGMDSELDWPVGRYFGLFMDDMVGKDFEKGLANLKEVAEMLPVQPKMAIEEVQVSEMTVISIKDSLPMEAIGMKMGENMAALAIYAEKKGLVMSGAPMCIYHAWNEQEGYTVMECALPFISDTEVKSTDLITVHSRPAHSAAKVVHMGSYEKLGMAHYAINDWIASNEKTLAGVPFEVYLTDPNSEPDTLKWTTEVYYPIQ